MEIVELGELSLADWVALVGRERAPFGERTAGLAWRPKDHYVAVRDPDGRLAAAGGVTVAGVQVGDEPAFEVVGFGGLIVRRDARGRGLMPVIMDGLVAVAQRLGPHRAMIFCEDHLAPLYARRGYVAIADEVSVDQPAGRIPMPLQAMWRPLRPGPGWPPGPVAVQGLPF